MKMKGMYLLGITKHTYIHFTNHKFPVYVSCPVVLNSVCGIIMPNNAFAFSGKLLKRSGCTCTLLLS